MTTRFNNPTTTVAGSLATRPRWDGTHEGRDPKAR